jgi:hypothetical protein
MMEEWATIYRTLLTGWLTCKIPPRGGFCFFNIYICKKGRLSMNKFFSHFALLTFSCLLVFLSVSSFAQDSIPNADFELWGGGEPDSWNTTNMVVLITPFTTVVKETSNPQSGTSCAKLQTITQNVLFQQVTLPGVLTLGLLNVDPIGQTASISGGAPFTGMPQSLNGYFKYQPSAGDSCLLGFGLTKWNNGIRDTIGFAYHAVGDVTNDWTAFNIPLDYLIWEAPDTLNIGLISSNIADGLTHTGSKLWVDNLSFTYGGVNIEGISFPAEFRIYADGERHCLIIQPDLQEIELVVMGVYDMTGRESIHQSGYLQHTEVTMNIGELAPGAYVFRANIPGKKPFARKFSILY